jgi:hypothetical protein
MLNHDESICVANILSDLHSSQNPNKPLLSWFTHALQQGRLTLSEPFGRHHK